MPWLLGGGVLLALLLSRTSTSAPTYTPALPPPTQPGGGGYQPPPSLQGHLAAVLAQPSGPPPVSPPASTAPTGMEAILNPPQGVTESVFPTPPYGSKPGHNQFAWWINHYTGSDYKNGETISQHDVDDAVHNAIHTGTLHDVYFLQEFATQLLSNGAASQPDWQLLKNFIISLQVDAIAPFVEHYAKVTAWPTPDPRATALRRANWDHHALLVAIANVKASGNLPDCKNLGMLLIGFTDPWSGDAWDPIGASLVAYANTPAFRAAAAAHAARSVPVSRAPSGPHPLQRAPIRPPSNSVIAVTPPPVSPPVSPPTDTGGGAPTYEWQDQGNATPPNVGDSVSAVLSGSDGSQYDVEGVVASSDGTNVTITAAADVTTGSETILAAGSPFTVPVSYVAVVAGVDQTYDAGLPPSDDGTYAGDTGPMSGG